MNKQLIMLGAILLGGANASSCGDGTVNGFALCDVSAPVDTSGLLYMKVGDNAVYRHTGLGITLDSLAADTCAFGEFVEVPICGEDGSCDSSNDNAGLNTQCTCSDGFSLSGLGVVKSYQPFAEGNQLTFFLEGDQEGPPSSSNQFYSDVGGYLRQNYCQASTCTNNVNVVNSQNAATAFDNMVTGDTEEHKCSDGYNANGEFTYNVACTADAGAATASIKNNAECAASACATVDIFVGGGYSSYTDMVTGDAVDHSCSDGYNAGGEYGYTVECTADADAETASIKNTVHCAASTCDAVPDTNSDTDTSGLVTGGTVSIQCKDGYNANGAFTYDATCTAVTGAETASIKDSDQCAASTCENNVNVDNSQNAATAFDNMVTGDTKEHKCSDGYNANDAYGYFVECTADSDAATASIKNTVDCAASACVTVDDPNSDTDTSGLVTGGSVSIQCKDGYNANGAFIYDATCTANPGAMTASIKDSNQCAASTCDANNDPNSDTDTSVGHRWFSIYTVQGWLQRQRRIHLYC